MGQSEGETHSAGSVKAALEEQPVNRKRQMK